MNTVIVSTETEPSTCNVTVTPWRRPWILILSPLREKRSCSDLRKRVRPYIFVAHPEIFVDLTTGNHYA
jgi:hypothetical protein